MEIKPLHMLDTEQPSDCLEWCTHPDYPHHFICGTYQLEEGETDFSQPPTSKSNSFLYILSEVHFNSPFPSVLIGIV